MEVITLLAGSKYVVIDGNLHVRDTQLEDTRLTYRCYAKHRLDDQQQAVSSPTRIRLEPGDGVPSAPRLVPPTLTLLHARAGQPAYLACGTYANPAPKIRYLIHSWLSSIVVSLLIVDSLAPNPRSQSPLPILAPRFFGRGGRPPDWIIELKLDYFKYGLVAVSIFDHVAELVRFYIINWWLGLDLRRGSAVYWTHNRVESYRTREKFQS